MLNLETPRLIIRDFHEADAGVLYDIKVDERVMYFCPDFLDVDIAADDVVGYIRGFNRAEAERDPDPWRCYAIEVKETHRVVGCLCFGKQNMLREYELGWMMLGAYAGKGYASESAAVFAEYICDACQIPYLIVVMDVDNPASYRCAEKAGFRLFEKRTVYDYSVNRYCDDYYCFRRYPSWSTCESKFYGDVPYEGRIVNSGEQ